MTDRSIFGWKNIMNDIKEISEREEDDYSDIPGFEGMVTMAPTEKAVCLVIKGEGVWFPYSQLRKAEDGQSIYASNWILEQKDLA